MALDVLMEGARVAAKNKKQCPDMETHNSGQPWEAALVAKAAAKAWNSTKRKRNEKEKENSSNKISRCKTMAPQLAWTLMLLIKPFGMSCATVPTNPFHLL
jgi:hypothetical protein